MDVTVIISSLLLINEAASNQGHALKVAETRNQANCMLHTIQGISFIPLAMEVLGVWLELYCQH